MPEETEAWHKSLQFWKLGYKLRLPKGEAGAAHVPKREQSLACPYLYPCLARRAQPCRTLQRATRAPLLSYIMHVAATAQIGIFALQKTSHSSLSSPQCTPMSKTDPNRLPSKARMPMDFFSYEACLTLTHINTAQ